MKQRRLAALLLCAALIMCMVPVCYAAVTVGPGDTGENVKKIQRRLIQYDYMSGTADGIYGNEFAILASDVAFSQRNIDDLVIPGYGFARKRQKKSIEWLKTMQADPKCVGVFCSHDPDVKPQTIEY